MLFALIFAAAAAATDGPHGAPDAARSRGARRRGRPFGREARGRRARRAGKEGFGAVAAGPLLFADAGFLSSNNPVTAFSLLLEQERFSAEKFFASDPNDPPYTKDWSGSVPPHGPRTFSAPRGPGAGGGAVGRGGRAHSGPRPGYGGLPGDHRLLGGAPCRGCGGDPAGTGSGRERRISEIAGMLAEEGVTTAADPARARAAVAEVRAELAGQQAELDGSRAALGAVIGSEAAARPLAPLPRALPLPAGRYSERADVAAAKLTADAAQETERAAAASRWPTLVVTGRYEVHAPHPRASTETPGRFSAASAFRSSLRVGSTPAWPRPGPRLSGAGGCPRGQPLGAKRDRPGAGRPRRSGRPARSVRAGEGRGAARPARSSRRATKKGPPGWPISSRRVPPSSGREWARPRRRPTGGSLRRRICGWPSGLPPEGDERGMTRSLRALALAALAATACAKKPETAPAPVERGGSDREGGATRPRPPRSSSTGPW